MHLAAKTTLQLTWVLPVKRLNIIRSRYSTATILRTQNPFPYATLPSPLALPFAVSLQPLVSRPSLRIVPTFARRPLRAHGTSASRQKHAPGEREAHSCKALQRASTTDHGTPVNTHRQPSTEDLDKQWRGVLFALTARVQIGRHTRPVSAKHTHVGL